MAGPITAHESTANAAATPRLVLRKDTNLTLSKKINKMLKKKYGHIKVVV
jgi:hypothetical protein